MAQVNLPVQVAPGDAAGKDITAGWTAADALGHKVFNGGGHVIVLVRTQAASSISVTVTSVADPYGRTGDLGPTAIVASKYYAFGPYSPGLFNQKSGADKDYFYLAEASIVGTVDLLALGW
jgi:hypothetical protein